MLWDIIELTHSVKISSIPETSCHKIGTRPDDLLTRQLDQANDIHATLHI